MSTTHKRFAILCILLALLPACGQAGTTTGRVLLTRTAARPAASATSTTSPTPVLTPTPSPTPTITPTPTLTPTPTPTAPPLTIVGDPRAGRLSAPAPQGNAPCGVVDLLDFPLDPPDAADNPSGGRDFGVFRDRYGKYHAGEDWWGPNRRSSFGRPVYSIGHGLVTYAEPEGWNRDKGVVIIQHTLADGAAILSFYGHLDPPSVVLQAGHCVARGEQIGQIGRPRGSPHLHFEIRTHSPYAPLTGYWPEDPTLVGWLPPSQIIWQQRIASAPGVQWTRPFVAGGTEGIGVVNGDTLIALEEAQLIGLDLANGSLRWRYTSVDDVSSALLDARAPVIYLAGRAGRIEALSLLDSQGAVATAATVPTFELLWQVELDAVGAPTLLPLAGGGVGVSVGRRLFGLAPDGTLTWTRESLGQPVAWAPAEDHLIVATTSQDSPLWQIDKAGPRVWGAPAWSGPANGRPVVANGQAWLYGRDGVYRLNPATQAAELQYALPPGLLSLGDMIALPDGGVLVAHADNFDRRLIALNADGTLRWQRSYAGLIAGSQHLLALGGEIFLVARDESGPGRLSVFAVDMASAELALIFTGGTRSSIPTDTWLLSDGRSRLVINIGGGHMLALDVAQARGMVAPALP